MEHTTTTEETSSYPDTSHMRPNTPSSVYSRHSRDAELGTDEGPASGEAVLGDGQYDHWSVLANFENTGAYTCPRPAPLPPRGIHPVLTAACSAPSPPPNEPLPLLPLSERPIALSYGSMSPWNSGPPSTLPAGPVRFSQPYRNSCMDQYLDGKQSVKKRGRDNLQGHWLARGTLRHSVQQQPEKGWELMEQKIERTKPTNGVDDSSPLCSRVRNSVRRSGTSAKLSLLKGFEEFARAGERIGHLPST